MKDSRKKLFKLINCADKDSIAGHEILEEIKAGKKEWGTLNSQEWALIYKFIEIKPGTTQHAAANTGYSRQDLATAAAILRAIRDGISDDYMQEWETMTASELLDMLDRQAGL